MEKTTTRVKKFWADNQTKILGTVAVIATGIAVVERIGLKQHDDFLREHDLYEKFYVMNEED